MKLAIDVSPLEDKSLLKHRVRGTGFYIQNLKSSLLKYFPENNYRFFIRGEELSKDLDLIHYPYFEPFFLTLPFFRNKKMAITVHDLTPLVFPKNFPSGIKGRIKWEIQKRILQGADVVITDSISSKKDIVKFTGISGSRINVVYLAASDNFKRINNPSFLDLIRKKFNLPEKFVLYVGDVTWNKNLPKLISAVESLNIPLIMVGKALIEKNVDAKNAWNQDLIKVQRQILNSKNIKALGFIETEDLVSIYNLATVFVMPSIYEGFGLPVLEAMSCGCPVVTTKCGSLPEVAGGAAFYVDVNDVDSISKGINTVSSNKILQKELSQKGLTQAKKFSWKNVAKDTMEVYKKAVNQT